MFVDVFPGWVETFPTKQEKTTMVAKKILEVKFPVVRSAQGNWVKGPAFTAKVSQGVTRYLEVDWKLHCIYRPQSSRQVERMNRTLKEALTKLTMETGAEWVVLLLWLFSELEITLPVSA